MLNTPTIRRPVLRYHGGKWRIAPWIISHFPDHRVYVEPYGGAASVLMRKPRSWAEIYNDLDEQIVNVFRVIRDKPAELCELVRNTPYSRVEFEQSYEPHPNAIEQARRTITRAFFGHGTASMAGHSTGFRAKSHSQHTGGAREWTNYPDQIRLFAERIRGVIVEHKDAAILIDDHDRPDTLFYVDPPYLPELRHPGNPHCRKGEYRHEMTREDHVSLLRRLREAEGKVIISGYPSDLYDEILHDWRREKRMAQADRAQPRTEVLWISPNVPRQQHDLFREEA